MTTFRTMGLPESLTHKLELMGLVTPTPIQLKAIPPALTGNDIIGSAQTGTGKTAAFSIPIISRLLLNPSSAALVMTPTRELAVQVITQIQSMLGKRSKIKSALLIGGEPMPKQFLQIRNSPRIIVGTPGRINDHLRRGTLNLDNTDFLVLDETDRMLDMGFSIQIEEAVKHIKIQHQTLLFSATLSQDIKKIAQKYLKNPISIAVAPTSIAAENIQQSSLKVKDSNKYDKLIDELDNREGSIIVFVKTKYGAERMALKLSNQGHSANAIHGNLRQNKRDRVIMDFRKKKHRILVATDVAARGLDIPHIEHVINYDLPQCPKDYIHRIGRTARAGAKGYAMSFISPGDKSKWSAINTLLKTR